MRVDRSSLLAASRQGDLLESERPSPLAVVEAVADKAWNDMEVDVEDVLPAGVLVVLHHSDAVGLERGADSAGNLGDGAEQVGTSVGRKSVDVGDVVDRNDQSVTPIRAALVQARKRQPAFTTVGDGPFVQSPAGDSAERAVVTSDTKWRARHTASSPTEETFAKAVGDPSLRGESACVSYRTGVVDSSIRLKPATPDDAEAVAEALLRNPEHMRPWERYRPTEFYAAKAQAERLSDPSVRRWHLIDGELVVGEATQLGLHRLEASTLLANTASQRVLHKCGFELIGTARGYLHIHGEWSDNRLFQRILHDNPPDGTQ